MGLRHRILLLLFSLLPVLAMDTLIAGKYDLTVEALQARYADEVVAHRKYNAYADQACKEGYPNIAHLFKALASSEAIHARNFKKLLRGFGAKPSGGGGPIAAGSTRTNLKQAATVERDEIDKTYPGLLEKIKGENHAGTIENITYAWKAEKQHRALIVKLQKASSSFFGMLVKRIEPDGSLHLTQDRLDPRPQGGPLRSQAPLALPVGQWGLRLGHPFGPAQGLGLIGPGLPPGLG